MNTRKRIGDLLIEANLVTEEQVEKALENRREGEKLGEALISQGMITGQQLNEVLEMQLGILSVSLYDYPISDMALQYVSRESAERNALIPLMVNDDELIVAMKDPTNYFIIDDLEMSTGLNISPVIASEDDINQAINRYYFKGAHQPKSQEGETGDIPVIQALDRMLTTGMQLRASDIHIDPQEESVHIRYRIDGQLQTEQRLSKDFQTPLVARIKILAGLNITVTRTPQDGRIQTEITGKQVDLRIAVLPTIHGEKVVIRILDLSTAMKSLAELGFLEQNLADFERLIEMPAGLILITGPTGSGKSSTLYAALNKLNSEDTNIITVEDPVEYQLARVNQVQVNTATGLTFAKGLRSILRQDPNIIMVGEIRDQETAEISIRASLTGHLVLSTLHTNNAVETIPRLMDMGIEPYLVVSSLTGVVAQRLIRRICRDCKIEREPTEMERDIFERHNVEMDKVFEGVGCNSCHQRGYRGRLAVHELLVVDDKIKNLLLDNATMEQIRQQAQDSGMKFLVEDGLEKVKSGLTTLEEVMQVAITS